jgi:lipopolysaccharide export system permease protein
MWILNWYVTRGFLLAFCMAIGILTFGMTGANIVKVLDFLAQGIPLMIFLKFMLYILPVILTFTVPWAVMVAVMLVFGRLSADSEITAMRACGVSILQIVSPILLITVGLTALCLYLQIEVGPPLLGKSRELLKIEAINQPLALFEPGRQIYYDNTIISIADKTPDGRLKGVQLYKLASRDTLALDISAVSGKLEVDKENQLLKVILYDCVLHDRRSNPETRMFHKELEFAFNYGKALNSMTLASKPKYMTVRDLMGLIKVYRQMNKDTTKL